MSKHLGKPRQIAFYGGTFTGLDIEARNLLLSKFKDFFQDDTWHFRISTRPDLIDAKILDWCWAKKIRTIELGIQDFSDEVLTACQRGYSSSDAIESCKLVLKRGFELAVQLMPGLPGWNKSSILQNRQVLSIIKPNLLRLYPCIVLKDTDLEELYRQGNFTPLTLETAIDICADYCELSEQIGTRVIKIGLPSVLESEDIVAGPYHPAFGELVQAECLIRNIELNHSCDKTIRIDKSKRSQILGHHAWGLKRLEKGIDYCKVRPVIEWI